MRVRRAIAYIVYWAVFITVALYILSNATRYPEG